MANGMSQKVIDDQYGRLDFKQTKGMDNSNIGTEVIHKAKGGMMADRQSESSKLDQKNAAMDKAEAEGYKRYQAEEKRQADENAAPRKAASEAVGKAFDYVKKGLGMKNGGTASSRADGCAQRGKTRGRMV
jgi:hypothetical protein